MLKLSLQFFAHKKGVGSTKNGRDSESKRLGVKKADGQSVVASVVKNGKSKKIDVIKYKAKKNEKKKIGHRQDYTKIQIEKIEG